MARVDPRCARIGTRDDGRVVGRGVETGYLGLAEWQAIARDGLARLPLDGRRVLVLVPDGTRTMDA